MSARAVSDRPALVTDVSGCTTCGRSLDEIDNHLDAALAADPLED